MTERRHLSDQIAYLASRVRDGISLPRSVPTGVVADPQHQREQLVVDAPAGEQPGGALVDGRRAAIPAGLVVRGSHEFAYTDEPNTSDVAERPDLRMMLHRKAVERAGELVTKATPAGGGATHAEVTLGLVERLLRDVTELVDRDPATSGTPQLDPAALGSMIATLGHVCEATETLLSASMRQVAAARTPATQGAFVAPPGADPLSELDAILRDLNVALHNVEMTTTRLDATGHRLGRVSPRIDPPPVRTTPPRAGGPGVC